MYKNNIEKINNKRISNRVSCFVKLCKNHSEYNTKYSNGFTLVELMVVISIFLMITAVTIFQYGTFRSNVSLQNLTDDIALSVRKAQSFAIGARGVKNNVGGVDFDKNYGIHFTIDTTPSSYQEGTNKSFILFSSADKKYDYSSSGTCGDSVSNECIELFNITTADKVEEIWVDGVQMNAQKASIDIVFRRPDPRAYFCYRSANTNSNGNCDNQTISSVKIVISNGAANQADIKTKKITIQNTGQISIE